MQRPGAVLRVFLAEATILSLVGAATGVAVGYAAITFIDHAYPLLSLAPPAWAVAAAVLVALVTGLLLECCRRGAPRVSTRSRRSPGDKGMRAMDLARLSAGSVAAHRSRSLLTSLGIAVGIAAVVLLTSIGEGVHRFVLQEFTQFGTNIIAVTPGKTETLGISGAQISNVRPLSLDDSAALERLEQVTAVVPVVQGNAEVSSRAAPAAR